MISLQLLNAWLCLTREECERLTSIIKSRVVDGPIIGDTKDQRLGEQPNRTIGCGITFIEALETQGNFQNCAAKFFL